MQAIVKISIPTYVDSKKKWVAILDYNGASTRVTATSAAGVMDGLIPALEKIKRDNDGSE